MENKSIKDKILYWGGITLISTVIIGGSYYIYQSLFGSSEEEKEKEDNDDSENNNNNSLNNSFQNTNNIDISSSNNKINNNINSIIFPKNENLNLTETNKNNNHINQNINNINNNISTKLIKDEEDPDVNEEKIINNNNETNNINIFNDNNILLKTFGINLDESRIFQNNNQLTEEGTVTLIIYINYLAEKFYNIDNPDLDEKRRNLLIKKNNGLINNDINSNEQIIEQEYFSLCNETLISKQNVYQIAGVKILNCLNNKITFERLEESLNKLEPKKLEDLTIKIMYELNTELHKYDLNMMDINQTKEAYIYYLTIFIENSKKIFEIQDKLKNEDENNINNEESNIIIFKVMSLKMQMDDQLFIKYKIVDEHLKLLVNKYNLLADNEVSQIQSEFENINDRFGGIK